MQVNERLDVIFGGGGTVLSLSGGDANGIELELNANVSGGQHYKIGVCDESHPWGRGLYIYNATAGRLEFFINANDGSFSIPALAGNGNRMVMVDSSGKLSTVPLLPVPPGGMTMCVVHI